MANHLNLHLIKQSIHQTNITAIGSKSYSVIPQSSFHVNEPKNHFGYQVYQADPKEYFEFGLVPVLIFCAAIFSVIWGVVQGLMIAQIDMENLEGIKECIIKYTESEEKNALTGGEKQASAQEVAHTIKLVGQKITDGAKAFLKREYLYLIIWTAVFAIVLGSTVDLLEMQVKVAPTNFPYTAVSFSTGSMTSIIAGYIGMRVAVFTNTRVTHTCCSSVHQGFITAFRGGQVLGFVLVGLGVMNILIIILIFKEAWYNEFITQVVQAGRPNNHCPSGDLKGYEHAQAWLTGHQELITKSMYTSYVTKFKAQCKCLTGYLDQSQWEIQDSDFLSQSKIWREEQTYEWTSIDQLECMEEYNSMFYNFKQRVCVLTRRLFELVAGYGLGGSSVALFGRVGGGIYTKAADVGADLVGKNLKDLKEDDITNPGTIADNVGDNVGDIAGMGSDLFGSLAESTCAALVVSATSYELITTKNALFFPICITASGIVASWFSVLLVHLQTVTTDNVQPVLKTQIGASTVIMTICVVLPVYILPETFTFEGGSNKKPLTMERWYAYGCVMFGLWSGMIIGFVTEYYTNNAWAPTLDLAAKCNKGAAPNIIMGLALGYISVVIPIVCITATIAFSFSHAGMYGIGLSALGMLGSLPVALSVDGYGPIADNAGGVASMCGLPSQIRDKTDALDAAGNTTAAVGKGFAIGSACLVGLALFGAFITRIGKQSVDILEPIQFSGLLIGAMLPYFFTALTMKAVGDAAYKMMEFIEKDYNAGQITIKEGNEYIPDYQGCIDISTKESLKKMIAPGFLVIGTPIIAGFIFGPNATAGILAGNIVSGVQVAFSQSNSGGAWDNAKKEIEKNRSDFKKEAVDALVNLDEYRRDFAILEAHRYTGQKDRFGVEIEIPGFDKDRYNELNEWMERDKSLKDQHIAAVVGDTVGDPLKDTSGPAINILIKLSAITSLVFGNYLEHYHIFGNPQKHSTEWKHLVKRCNTIGENPNTTDYLKAACKHAFHKGLVGSQFEAPHHLKTHSTKLLSK